MAIAANSLTSGTSTTDGTGFITTGVTFGSGRLVLVAVAFVDPTRADTDPTLTGAISFSSVLPSIRVDSGTGSYLGLFVGVGSGGSSTISIDFSVTVTAIAWSVVEFTGATTSLVQNANTPETVGTAWTAGTLSAFSNANNRPYACYGGVDNTAGNVLQEATWTEIHEVQASTPSIKLETCWNPTTADLTPTATGPNVSFAGVSVEIGAVPTVNYTKGNYSVDYGVRSPNTRYSNSKQGYSAMNPDYLAKEFMSMDLGEPPPKEVVDISHGRK